MKLKFLLMVAGVLLSQKLYAQTTGVCDRSEIIQEAIQSVVQKDCADITPKDLLQVTWLEVVSGEKNEVYAFDLQGLKNLTHLDLAYTGIHQVPEGFLEELPSLEWVTLLGTSVGKARVNELRAQYPAVEFVY